MNRKDVIENLKNRLNDLHNGYQTYLEHGGKQDIETENDIEALNMAIESLQEPERKWIPITYHEPIEEDGEDTRYGYILDCQMPEEEQEILVSFNGMVDMDVCCYDDGWYLDRRGDWTDVDAWMPLPEPYKAGEQE